MYTVELAAGRSGSGLEIAPQPRGLVEAGPFYDFDAEQARLAILAKDIFLSAFDATGRYVAVYSEIPKDALAQAVACEGVARVAMGFRLFRQAMGEPDGGGLTIVTSDSTRPTSAADYRRHIQCKELVINKWLGTHDEKNHLAGGMLATDEITGVLAVAAEKADDDTLPEELQVLAVRDIDDATSYIRQIWQKRAHADSQINHLASMIVSMFQRSGVELTRQDALGLASRQDEAIRQWFYLADMLPLTGTATTTR